jgi:hypothetical protein
LIAKWLSIFGSAAKSIRLKDNYPFLGNDGLPRETTEEGVKVDHATLNRWVIKYSVFLDFRPLINVIKPNHWTDSEYIPF